MNTISAIIKWFKLAKPNPTQKDALTQIGCHFEEVAEMATAVNDPDTAREICTTADWHKSQGKKEVDDSDVAEFIDSFDKLELLDSLCDQIVTAVGVAYMMGFDIEKALAEVNRSNYSKFDNGKPLFDKNGKIIKSETYQPPQLEQYLENKNESRIY